MKKLFIITITAASALLALSCSKIIEFKGEQVEEKLVIFAEARPGEPFTVNLSHSVFFLDAYQGYDKYIRHINADSCRVEVSFNGGKPVSMTYLPGEEPDPYFFQVGTLTYVCNCIPSAGDEIEVSVSAPGYDPVKASVSVPRQPQAVIRSHSVTDTVSYDYYSSVKHNITLEINDPGQYSKYYRLNALQVYKDPSTAEVTVYGIFPVYSSDPVFISTSSDLYGIIDNIETIEGGESERKVPDFFSDQLFFGGSYSLTFNFTRSEYSYDPTIGYEARKAVRRAAADLPYGESLAILLRAVTPGTYYYLSSRDNTGGDFAMFAEGSVIYSNVEGGYGALCAGADAFFVLED